LKKNDYFLYWTYLDNFPLATIEALASNMKVLVNDFESFKYFLDGDMICSSQDEMVNKLIYYDINKQDISKYDRKCILEKLCKFINV